MKDLRNQTFVLIFMREMSSFILNPLFRIEVKVHTYNLQNHTIRHRTYSMQYILYIQNTHLEHICHSLCSIFMSLSFPLLYIDRHSRIYKQQTVNYLDLTFYKETTSSPYLFSFGVMLTKHYGVEKFSTQTFRRVGIQNGGQVMNGTFVIDM